MLSINSASKFKLTPVNFSSGPNPLLYFPSTFSTPPDLTPGANCITEY